MLGLLAAIYRLVARPLLFLCEAERAHDLAARLLGMLHRSKALRALLGPRERLETDALGLSFPSPVGVAAGFDKSARFFDGLGALGFGFVEVGTVTARPQPGNPRPRLFRLPRDRALVNRLGFNNPGAAAVARALADHAQTRPAAGRCLVGVNIGKSRATALEDAPADYAESARLLAPLADYLVVNVSSPNTPGLRALQALAPLRAILTSVQHEVAASQQGGRRVPLLVKIAPDLPDDEIDALADLARELRLDGVVATNTTVARAGLRTDKAVLDRIGEGGLSGPPLRERSLAVVARLRARLGAGAAIIAVGGIACADDAWAAIAAGADLVQVYTALVYEGPALARDLVRGLRRRIEASRRADRGS